MCFQTFRSVLAMVCCVIWCVWCCVVRAKLGPNWGETTSNKRGAQILNQKGKKDRRIILILCVVSRLGFQRMQHNFIHIDFM